MQLKLIVAFVSDEISETVIDAARAQGATGATTITSCRGEGLKKEKTFFGLDLTAQRDVLLFIVAEPRARHILETIAEAGRFDEEPGTGIVFQLSIEDAVGLRSQLPTLMEEIEEEI
jgi:nitrogen regulatory protein PII